MEVIEKENVNTFTLGVTVGIQMMKNKIKSNHEQGKPVLVDDELYYMTDSKEHLKQVMEQYNQDIIQGR
jgi:hydroxyethylthiazole kinase-like sugar kinase family protein